MAVRLQIRNDTAENWQTHNPILAVGELAIEIDTRKFKIGNGNQDWNSLPYATQGEQGFSLDFIWDGTKLGLKRENDLDYVYVDLEGKKGDSIEYLWSGTTLGIKTESESTFSFMNLKGEPGEQGKTGSIDNLEDYHITDTLGYEPMPISGGTLENYVEKVTTVDASNGIIDLSLGNVFVHTPDGNRSYSFNNSQTGAHSFTLIINMGSVSRVLTFPSSIKWQNGDLPDLTETNKSYVLTFLTVDNGSKWLGMFGGNF